ncbi:GAF domain-containing protein [Vogesella sp. LIG4]|uniref:GAF domain-containing protein n=1 Tax=Vogesella sp. LIG4 TaxID=1192162 RepID=UPI00081F92ED|nr:GAF domain-containing protein [Vogesella sp. LIG4]SCK28473.1 GAF domain-containing protein, putative methionine-R-sulfoxide reductase [Vogesella sp. LIG4]
MSRAASYLQQAQLDLSAASLQQAVAVLEASLAQPPAARSEDELFSYRVPKLGEGGSCSLVDELEEAPYELSPWLGGRTADASARLRQLDALVQAALRLVPADWLGVYCRFERDGAARLVKLAYRGLPSRAEFPLDEAFAQFSNNSRVGLSGKGAVIADVGAWQQAGGAYYECDPRVQSEVCLPVLAADGRVLGILDAEDARAGFFDEYKQTVLAALALALVQPFAELAANPVENF